MASTYSTNLGIELIGSGEQAGTWGTTTNTNLGTLLEQAISGYVVYNCTGGTDTITIPNGASGVARNMYLELQVTGGGTLVVPTNKKLYFIYNRTNGPVTVKVSGQTGVLVPTNARIALACDGTDIVVAENYLASLTLGAALPVASGGSGVTSATAYAVLCGGTTSTNPIQAIASVGTTGQVLTSNGAAALPTMQTITSFVAGMIILWSGSSASIPSGFLLCDGTSSTPDLRNRFVVGAGSTYAVNATGGSANAVVVSHTHTATVTDPGHTHQVGRANQITAVASGPTVADFADQSTAVQSTQSAVTGITVSNSTEGVSGTNANLPPYYALCYIMKT
jgi:hypothetical protein